MKKNYKLIFRVCSIAVIEIVANSTTEALVMSETAIKDLYKDKKGCYIEFEDIIETDEEPDEK